MQWNVYLENTVSTVVTVEAETQQEAIDAAREGNLPTLCHQCNGGEHYGQNMEISGEWDLSPAMSLNDSAYPADSR